MGDKLWEPPLASPKLEELMEAKSVDEGDRDEIRRFSQILGVFKDDDEGKPKQPLPPGMKDWALGNH